MPIFYENSNGESIPFVAMFQKKNLMMAIDFIGGVWYNGGMENNVNKNSKSILSRLLATENIFVIHDNKATTASFDIMNRVLRLPVFKDMSEEMYDMLVGHEVAHALYTPFTEEDTKSLKEHGYLSCALKIADGDVDMAPLAHSYMNVVEDARIERMIKDKFAGIRRDFFVAYKELNDRDFFEIQGKNIAEMSFIDRINLFFKIGSHITVPFSAEEMEFVKMVENTLTFDDVIDTTKKIWQYCKDKKKQGESTTEGDLITVKVDGKAKGDEDSEDESTGSASKKNQWTDRGIKPDECATQQNFDKNAEDLRDEFSYEIDYNSLPKFNMKDNIVPFKELMSMFDVMAGCYINHYAEIQNESRKFIDESNRVVNILAQEFMAKKAARDHHRNSTYRSGVIDTVRMMNYKVTDDIFLRMKMVKKGKSHGLVFFTDLSGSMSPVLEDTFKQLVQLVLFCKRVNIPFEVYGFTTRSRDGLEVSDYDHSNDEYKRKINATWQIGNDPYANDRCPLNPFTLVNLLSSKMTKRELEIGIRNIFAVSHYYKRSSVHPIPAVMQLSSTPLVESIVAAMDIVPLFKQNNNLDIVHTVFLTDGEATSVAINRGSYCFKNNQLFKLDKSLTVESSMVKVFREVTGAKAIMFFLSDQKTTVPYWAVCGYYGYGTDTKSAAHADYDEKNKQYCKEQWTVAHPKSHGYNEKFILRANSAVEYNDLEEILSGKTSNVGIRNGFMKAMTRNLVSRVMLNRFISLIATE